MFIKDNNTYILSKDSKNNDVTNKQIQDIVFKIILEVDRICRKESIPYALGFGNALGLHNYGGFIPWDDDADIVIDYFDYPRFIEAVKKNLKDEFYLDCYDVNNQFNPLIPPAKIRYKLSKIKERNRFTLPDKGCEYQGIFVDIICFMGVPEERKEHLKLIHKTKRIMPWFVLFDGLLKFNLQKERKRLKEFEREIATKYKDSKMVSQDIIIPFQEHPKKERFNLSFPHEVIYPFKEYDFNGHKLFSFNNIEEFCRLFYGEQSLKRLNFSGEYIDPYKESHKKSKHLVKVDIIS